MRREFLGELLAPLVLTGKLWWRFWPQLTLLVLIGILLNDQLLLLSAKIGFVDRSLGFAALTLVVLTKLVVTVLGFMLMRSALPAIAAARALSTGAAVPITGPEDAAAGGSPATPPAPVTPAAITRRQRLTGFATTLTIALVPFFAYYAAWGFLNDTIREYSMLGLSLDPFGEGGSLLDAIGARWLAVSVVATWLLRRLFKMLRDRTDAPIWKLLIVLCETNWVFIGLFVLSQWKDETLAWVASGAAWTWLNGIWQAVLTPISTAFAASEPIEQVPPDAGTVALGLFFYALLPLIWLVMAALIYGHDLGGDPDWMRHRRLERISSRYAALPKFVRDFIGHFANGYRSRYLPIANSIRLTMGADLGLLLTLIVGWRGIGWAADWAWIGATHLIGPHPLPLWRVLGDGLSLLLGSPSGTTPGILVEPLRLCLVAAVLETAFARSQAPAEPEAKAEAAAS
ncbi:hypothetical protein [Inquilinus limosus]|uniref:Uncharacterized protein n=1 Tax=Inquilinus limosus TaxID=171674 RepID=A0A211Z9U3_9PROT|nr:hypothetical protein [Inquilinus limosus]OWJ62031.1 hypothetical protein BWR60_30535 [Inquilinus limosus]